MTTKRAERQQPQVFSAAELKQWVGEEEAFPGIWRPARPLPFGVFWWRPDMLRMRLRAAWGVLMGRYDAVNWSLPRSAYLPLRRPRCGHPQGSDTCPRCGP